MKGVFSIDKFLLSDEAYEILKFFSSKSSVPNEQIGQFPDNCIEQLLNYKLIGCRIVDYDTSVEYPLPTASEYFITELGKGCLTMRRNEDETFRSLKSIADSAKEQSKAAKIQAVLALKAAADAQKDAKRAKRESFIAKIFSVISIIVAISVPFLNAYATELVDRLLSIF